MARSLKELLNLQGANIDLLNEEELQGVKADVGAALAGTMEEYERGKLGLLNIWIDDGLKEWKRWRGAEGHRFCPCGGKREITGQKFDRDPGFESGQVGVYGGRTRGEVLTVRCTRCGREEGVRR